MSTNCISISTKFYVNKYKTEITNKLNWVLISCPIFINLDLHIEQLFSEGLKTGGDAHIGVLLQRKISVFTSKVKRVCHVIASTFLASQDAPGVSGNSRSRPFPGIPASHSGSRILGIIFHSRSRSQNLGM